jgi:hypothetical protein
MRPVPTRTADPADALDDIAAELAAHRCPYCDWESHFRRRALADLFGRNQVRGTCLIACPQCRKGSLLAIDRPQGCAARAAQLAPAKQGAE